MSMKIYNLTIAFNPDTEEIEYIEETVESDGNNDIEEMFHYVDVDLSEYFDEEDLKIIGGTYNVGIT